MEEAALQLLWNPRFQSQGNYYTTAEGIQAMRWDRDSKAIGGSGISETAKRWVTIKT